MLATVVLLMLDGGEVRVKILPPGEAAQFHGAEDDAEVARSVEAPASTVRAVGGDASPSALTPRAAHLLQQVMAEKKRSLRDVAAAWVCSHQLVHKVARGERPFTVAQVLSLLRRDPVLGGELIRRLALELDEEPLRALTEALVDHRGGEMRAGIGHGV